MKISSLISFIALLFATTSAPAAEGQQPGASEGSTSAAAQMTTDEITEFWNRLPVAQQKASEEFQRSANRTAPWKTLEKVVVRGTPSAVVERLLGKPEKALSEGKVWMYSLFYSSFLKIEFDQDMLVKTSSVR